ncbi:MAG: hypothetical protein EHM81_05760, partial [Chloroflexi bacterium]
MLKNSPTRKLDPDRLATLVLFAAVLFGALVRCLPAYLAGFPVNDGGMFYVMMKDLQANHFMPP